MIDIDIETLSSKIYQLSVAIKDKLIMDNLKEKDSYSPKFELVRILLGICIWRKFQKYYSTHKDIGIHHFVFDESLNPRNFKIIIHDINNNREFEYEDSCDSIVSLNANGMREFVDTLHF